MAFVTSSRKIGHNVVRIKCLMLSLVAQTSITARVSLQASSKRAKCKKGTDVLILTLAQEHLAVQTGACKKHSAVVKFRACSRV